jgi:hypothetical protein
MNDRALEYLDNSDGWEIGVGPSIVIVDKGKAKSLTTTTLREDVYAFTFNQKGLMARLGLQGSKITRISPLGSVWATFSPPAPASNEQNWLLSNPGKGRFPYFRNDLYSMDPGQSIC